MAVGSGFVSQMISAISHAFPGTLPSNRNPTLASAKSTVRSLTSKLPRRVLAPSRLVTWKGTTDSTG